MFRAVARLVNAVSDHELNLPGRWAVGLLVHFPRPLPIFNLPMPPQKSTPLRTHRQAGSSERGFISFWLSLSSVGEKIEIAEIETCSQTADF